MRKVPVNVVLQRTGKKCTKNYNARAQLLFSLNFLFSDFPVAVAVVFPDNLSAELSAST